jgi:hypothetical protein
MIESHGGRAMIESHRSGGERAGRRRGRGAHHRSRGARRATRGRSRMQAHGRRRMRRRPGRPLNDASLDDVRTTADQIRRPAGFPLSASAMQLSDL